MTIKNIVKKLFPADGPQIVLAGQDKRGTFDSYSAAFPSVLEENGEIFLYYTGSPDRSWNFASIGVACSKNGYSFTRGDQAIFADQPLSDFAWEAVTPAVARVKSHYFMILSGRKHRYNRRVLGIAYSDDPKGPFEFLKVIHKPSERWEGFSIDNGTTLTKTGIDTLTLYYSNCAPPLTDVMLRRTMLRKIGILKIRINGIAPESIDVVGQREGPLLGLNGKIGDWNESVFCPGYLQCQNTGILFFASSTYSGILAPQSIGYALVDSPTINRILCEPRMLLDRSNFKSLLDFPLAFDSPCPLAADDGKIHLFCSVMDKGLRSWKIAQITIEYSC